MTKAKTCTFNLLTLSLFLLFFNFIILLLLLLLLLLIIIIIIIIIIIKQASTNDETEEVASQMGQVLADESEALLHHHLHPSITTDTQATLQPITAPLFVYFQPVILNTLHFHSSISKCT